MMTKNSNQLFVFSDGSTQSYPHVCSDESALVVLTSEYAEPITEKSQKELAGEAQSYLNSTDWIEAKYVREVLRNKSMTEEEFNLKYSVELDKREDAIAVISDYEDSL